jgi:hypothetical protein
VTRWLAFLAAAAVAVATMMAVVRAPRLSCASLEADRCIAGASAMLDRTQTGPRIVAIGLVGYRGCFPGPVYCPLIPNETTGPLNAVAAVEYADGRRAAFDVWGLDPGGRLTVSPMQDDLIAYSLALVFPNR